MLPKKVSSGLAPEAVPELVPELAHGVALSVVHEPVRAPWVDLSPSPVHALGREVALEVGKEVVPVSLGLPEVQME